MTDASTETPNDDTAVRNTEPIIAEIFHEGTLMVSLVSNDGHVGKLPAKAAKLSEMVKDSLGQPEDIDEDDESEPEPLPLPRVSGKCLEKIVEFLVHHAEEAMITIPTPFSENNFHGVMTQKWYQDFISEDTISNDMLFEMLSAANYMGIKPLLDLCCLRITFEMAGKGVEEIRSFLNLPALTDEEESRAREEHGWIFEDTSV